MARSTTQTKQSKARRGSASSDRVCASEPGTFNGEEIMKDRIIELLRSTGRAGMDDLIDYLDANGFFESPASTRFHGACEGGLAKHSLGVYDMFIKLIPKNIFDIASPGQKPLLPTNIEHTAAITCLLHDICKVGAYIPTPDGKNPYKWNKQQPKGHALLSVERVKALIELEPIEELMIKFHMGLYGLNEFYKGSKWETGEYDLCGDHSKDSEMTKEQSQEYRYGQSLKNAWFHNPICKIIYFADELETLEDKAK